MTTTYDQILTRDGKDITLNTTQRKTKRSMFQAILDNKEAVLEMFDYS